MTRSEFTKSMKDYTECPFITPDQLRKFFGYKDRHSVRKYLCGLQPVTGVKYYIEDVVEKILGGN